MPRCRIASPSEPSYGVDAAAVEIGRRTKLGVVGHLDGLGVGLEAVSTVGSKKLPPWAARLAPSSSRCTASSAIARSHRLGQIQDSRAGLSAGRHSPRPPSISDARGAVLRLQYFNYAAISLLGSAKGP